MNDDVWMIVVNTARIALFVLLAIAFNKWWIALLSAFFLVGHNDK